MIRLAGDGFFFSDVVIKLCLSSPNYELSVELIIAYNNTSEKLYSQAGSAEKSAGPLCKEVFLYG